MRFVLLIALLFMSLTFASAQENTNTKTGSIAGCVTLANKGVAGVTVTVTMSGDALSGSGLKLSAITDDEGRFSLSNLPPTTYFVWPFVPAFVVAEATGVHPSGKSVTVVAGETAEEINFTLMRGAVITGKVTDTTDAPSLMSVFAFFLLRRTCGDLLVPSTRASTTFELMIVGSTERMVYPEALTESRLVIRSLSPSPVQVVGAFIRKHSIRMLMMKRKHRSLNSRKEVKRTEST